MIVEYTKVLSYADSVRDIASQVCQVIAGSNDGYFIEAFGKSYRFASVEDPAMIADFFKTIVSMGPITTIS